MSMTLEQVRDALLKLSRGRMDCVELREMADAIDAHLAQPAQSVDVLTIREVILALQGHVSPAWTRLKCADKLTAALPEKGNG